MRSKVYNHPVAGMHMIEACMSCASSQSQRKRGDFCDNADEASLGSLSYIRETQKTSRSLCAKTNVKRG